jgi:hypothetical protein
MNTSTESYLRERVKELENQLAKERAENLVILENVRRSVRGL